MSTTRSGIFGRFKKPRATNTYIHAPRTVNKKLNINATNYMYTKELDNGQRVEVEKRFLWADQVLQSAAAGWKVLQNIVTSKRFLQDEIARSDVRNGIKVALEIKHVLSEIDQLRGILKKQREVWKEARYGRYTVKTPLPMWPIKPLGALYETRKKTLDLTYKPGVYKPHSTLKQNIFAPSIVKFLDDGGKRYETLHALLVKLGATAVLEKNKPTHPTHMKRNNKHFWYPNYVHATRLSSSKQSLQLEQLEKELGDVHNKLGKQTAKLTKCETDLKAWQRQHQTLEAWQTNNKRQQNAMVSKLDELENDRRALYEEAVKLHKENTGLKKKLTECEKDSEYWKKLAEKQHQR